MLIAGLANGNLNEYDLIMKVLLRTIKTGHTNYILKICIISDGLILTGSYGDSNAKIIDIKTEECIKTFKQSSSIYCVGRLRDGRVIIGGTEKKLTFIS